MQKSPLYIHLHIPKTAGYTFRYHVSKNIKKDEQLFLCYEFLGLDLFNPPLDPQIYRKKAFNLVKKLTKEKRDKIKIIHGHTVPYGIHEFFNKEPRYFTFVRDVVERTVSIYNHLSYLNSIEGFEDRKNPYYEKYLLLKGHDVGFANWLVKKYVSDTKYKHFSMSGYLQEFGYLNGSINYENIDLALKKFFFIGKTNDFYKESLYFFHELNMHKYFIDQNISKRMFSLDDDKGLKNEILSRNKLDEYLYKKSLAFNNEFKKAHPEFENIVFRVDSERKLLLPATQLLFAPRQTILRLLKLFFRKEPLYTGNKST